MNPWIRRGLIGVAVQPVDWVRTVRHGIKRNGKPVVIMPSVDDNRFTDVDMGAVIAYALSPSVT